MKQGTELVKLKHGDGKNAITEDLQTQFTFSNKPPEGYCDHHQLVTTYVANISGPAEASIPTRGHKPGRSSKTTIRLPCSSILIRPPAAPASRLLRGSSRAVPSPSLASAAPVVMSGLAGKDAGQRIHLFDGDRFGQHNAFRAPGAPSIDELKARPYKVDYFASIYSRMRRGIIPHQFHMTAENVALMKSMEFVFICMDAGKAKLAVVEKLEAIGHSVRRCRHGRQHR